MRSRPRGGKPQPQKTRPERVEYVAQMKRRMLWVRSSTPHVLAERWDIPASEVQRIAADASRVIAKELLDTETARETVAGALMTVIDRSLADDDRKNVIDACKAYAQVAGIVTTKTTLDLVSSMSPEEKRAEWKRLTGREWEDPWPIQTPPPTPS